jgi:hypothetical protein
VGVYLGKQVRATRIDWFWEASWRENGKLRCRRFFIGKRSYREAMRLGKEARAKAVNPWSQAIRPPAI